MDAEVLLLVLMTKEAYKGKSEMNIGRGDGKLHVHISCLRSTENHEKSLADALE